jgi:hypothetical protein
MAVVISLTIILAYLIGLEKADHNNHVSKRVNWLRQSICLPEAHYLI